MDIISPAVRSRVMGAIRGRGTSIETKFEDALKSTRFKFVTHPKWLGSPDVAFSGRGVVVFLDSCFWHKCPVHFRAPKSRQEYWVPKIQRNVERDCAIRAEYERRNWHVISLWEHQISQDVAGSVAQVVTVLRSRRIGRYAPPLPRRTPGGGVRFR